MAIVGTVSALTANNRNFRVFNLTVAADGNTGPDTVAHGMGVAPYAWLCIGLTTALSPEWAITVVDATNITLAKQGTAGSAGGGPPNIVGQLVCMRPTSLLK